MTAAELSEVLFSPVTVVLYGLAMAAYLYAMAFTRVDRADGDAAVAGVRGQRIATALAIAGLTTHLGHLVARSVASGGRVPWGNMFEYSSVMAFGVVLAGVVVFQWRLKRPEVVGFLILGGLLTMGAAALVWSEPGPLVAILQSHWLKIHVFAIMAAATIFTVAFIFNGLFLLRDTAERRVVRAQEDRPAVAGGAYDRPMTDVADPVTTAVEGRRNPDDLDAGDHGRMHGDALRAAISPLWLFIGTWVGTATIAWTFWYAGDVNRFFTVNTSVALAALVAWRFVHRLPSATTLDSLTYRTISFGFPVWTFAVLAGAIWAEQSWGRYWGWDPKETSAFLTWIGYAAYLHARATRGMRGRGAAWIGIGAFWILMFTYFTVNLVVTGLHSYAGLQ
jgi:cytochrome c-type biogenesis protein CcsB